MLCTLIVQKLFSHYNKMVGKSSIPLVSHYQCVLITDQTIVDFFFNVFVYKVTKTTKHCADCTGITVSALFLLPSFNLKT